MSSAAPGPVSSLLVTDVTAYTRYAHCPSCSLQPPPPAGFPLCGGSEVAWPLPTLGADYLLQPPLQDIGGLSSGPYLCVSMTIPNHRLHFLCIPLILPFFQAFVLVYMPGMPTTDAHWPTPLHPSCPSSDFPWGVFPFRCFFAYTTTALPPTIALSFLYNYSVLVCVTGIPCFTVFCFIVLCRYCIF